MDVKIIQKKSSATQVGEHTACRYLIFTVSAFDNGKNKYYIQRWTLHEKILWKLKRAWDGND